MNKNEFEDMLDVTDLITAEDEIILTEETTNELVQTIFHLMEEYINTNPKDISEPDFHENLIENVNEIICLQFEDEILIYPDFEDDIEELIEETAELFYLSYIPKRSFPESIIINKNIDHKKIEEKLIYLKSKPQPIQRTKEWYEFRHNLITASNAYKAFENQNIQNQLIYEKCQPLIINEDINKPQFVNVNSTLHWGQKYEPLSVMIYEEMYNTKVGDFGCIQHEKYSFIGASPDGINIDPNSERYGRMLEIKNIVNREIDGIPKKEYWIQMQLQMEVCDLEECDFLETKFIEYDTTDEKTIFTLFKEDGEFVNKSYENEKRGIILYFTKSGGVPFYVFCPLNIESFEELDKWEEETINKYVSDEYNMTYIKNIYWKLEKISCVLVLRNRIWFENNIQDLKEIWNIIENERITGHEHRASIKKLKKNINESTSIDINLNLNDSTTSLSNNGCLINLNKDTNKIIVVNTSSSTPSVVDYFKKEKENNKQMEVPIIKIRTESFDETKSRNL